MSLKEFQRALSEFVASPAMCGTLRRGDARVLAPYRLSDRERRRLVSAVLQRGMSTNCSLYRSNRITPLYTLLNYTCLLLGDALAHEVDLFWEASEAFEIQYKEETARFATFLRNRLAAGELRNPWLLETLDFETATNELRFAPRKELLRAASRTSVTADAGGLQLHPLMRVVRFTHEPLALLRLLADRQPAPYTLPEGMHYVLLSRLDETLQAYVLDCDLGRKLSNDTDVGQAAHGPCHYPPPETRIAFPSELHLGGQPKTGQ